MHPLPSSLRATAGLVLAVAGLTTSAVLTAAPASATPPSGTPVVATGPTSQAAAAAGARWMADNLTDGVLHTGPGRRANLGLTLELGQALVSLGEQQPAVRAIRERLDAEVDTFTGGQTPATTPTAKALMFVTAVGGDPRSVGPSRTDLVARTESLLMRDQSYTGRLTSGTSWLQAYAATGLAAAGSEHAAELLDFTLQQQCRAGFFRLSLSRTDAADQSCEASSDATRAQSADVSAAVAINLAPLAGENPRVAAALENVGRWLLAQQQPDGSFVDVFSQRANANTTGLAGWALGVTGQEEAAARAATWLRARQVIGACQPSMATETGAIAYTDAAWAEGEKYGISDPVDRLQWLMVGAQALGALRWAPSGPQDLAISAPATATPGSTVPVTVLGLAPGERACVSGDLTQPLQGSHETVELQLPAGAVGTRQVSVHGTAGSVTATIRVIAPTTSTPGTSTPTTPGTAPAPAVRKLTVRAPRRAVRGTRVRVVVRGAAAREKMRITLAGRTVVRRATAAGVWRGTLKVTGRPGRHRVVVRTLQSQRRTATPLRVVRRR